jgi:hypothetical protein
MEFVFEVESAQKPSYVAQVVFRYYERSRPLVVIEGTGELPSPTRNSDRVRQRANACWELLR